MLDIRYSSIAASLASARSKIGLDIESAYSFYWPNYDNATCTELYTITKTVTVITQMETFAFTVEGLIPKTSGSSSVQPIMTWASSASALVPDKTNSVQKTGLENEKPGHRTSAKTNIKGASRQKPTSHSTLPDQTKTGHRETLPADTDGTKPVGTNTKAKPTTDPDPNRKPTHGHNHEGRPVNGVKASDTAKPAVNSENGRPVITVGTLAVTANSRSKYKISGKTLEPGKRITIGSGTLATTVAMETKGTATYVAVNGNTSEVRAAPSDVGVTEVLIGKQTLTAGSSMIASGHTYSLANSDSVIYVDGHPDKVTLNDATSVATLSNGFVVTEIVPTHPRSTQHASTNGRDPGTMSTTVPEYLLGSYTLLPGSTAVMSGTTYSLAPGGSVLYVNGHAETVSANASDHVVTLENGVVVTETGVTTLLATRAGKGSASSSSVVVTKGSGCLLQASTFRVLAIAVIGGSWALM